jgi:ABC-type sugar transport system substrate-binding protein
MAGRLLVALVDEQQDYHRMQAAAAREAAQRVGLAVDVVFAENTALLQIHQLFERIHAPEGERPAAIVVHSVTGEGLERVARNAVTAGIGWILLNRRVGYLAALRQVRPDLPIAAVSPDQIEIGRIHGRQARVLAPHAGLLLYVQGPPGVSAAEDRLSGTQQVLADSAFRWKVVNGNWTESSAITAVGGWLRLKTSAAQKPALVIAQNDAMAVGARGAVLAHDVGWRDVPVIGCDGLPEHGQKLVGSGELAATVVMPASAGAAVDLIAQWLRDGTLPPAEVVLPPQSFPAEERLRRP